MDSQTTLSAIRDPLFAAATLHGGSIRNAETNDVQSNTNTIEYEKTSYLNNALEESSNPPPGTGIPSIQMPLIPATADESPIPPTISLNLPRELVEPILLLLDIKSILNCRLLNKEFNAIIQSSTLIQYYLACKTAGVIDNPKSPLSCAERFEALKKREEAWRKLNPVFETTIEVNDQTSTLYELTAGNYFLSDQNRRNLYCCCLPSSPQDNPKWIRIPGHGQGQHCSGYIVEMGMAIYEHDLVVNVISSQDGNSVDMQQHSLDLVLLKFSTGEHHPLARHPLIHIQRSRSGQPYTAVRIVGDNLALVVHDHDGGKLFIFDWKTGHKRLQHKATEGGYSDLVFISPELLLVPNFILSHFEVWRLCSSHANHDPPAQILSLQIPAASESYSIISIDCHGEINPFLHSMPYFRRRPFFPSPKNSIITINIRLESLYGVFHLRRSAYKLIMHRRPLLDMIQKWTSHTLLEREDLTWLTNEVTVHKVADPGGGSVRLGAKSELVTTTMHAESSPRTRDSPTLATSPISPISPMSVSSGSSSISSESALSTSRYNILQVPWADWGPPISRWFQVKETHMWCIKQSTGQRYVFLEPNPDDPRKCRISVADFNLHNVKRNAEMMAQLRNEGEDNGGNGNDKQEKKEENERLEVLDHEGVFSEEVYMGLKCVVNHVPGEYDFDVLMMDEERLLGLKLDNEYRDESIKILYFG